MSLTRADLVRAALDVLDEGGIDTVTVRAVATRLGVKAPALYWHVRNKQDLLDEMGTEVLRRIVASAPHVGLSWQEQLRGFAHAMRDEYLRHRDGARTFSGTRITDPGLLRAQEPLLAAMTRSVPLAVAVQAFDLVTAFVTGFVVEEQERAQSEPERYDLEARNAALADSPNVREAGRLLFGDATARFARYLDVVVAGIESSQGQLTSAGSPAQEGRSSDAARPSGQTRRKSHHEQEGAGTAG